METPLKRTWAEIDLDALAHNFEAIRGRLGGAKLLGVVKADAYGHGAVPVAKTLERCGAAYLAVSNLDEAAELRAGGVALPILILGYTPPEQTARLLRLGVTQTVADWETARAYDEAAARAGAPLTVHVKLDTGMGRLGFPCDAARFDASLRGVLAVAALPRLDVEGAFTHFAVSDEDAPEHAAFTEEQHERFERMLAAAERGGVRFRIRHCCNGGAIASHPEWAADMARCGILLYGTGALAERLGLVPVMTLKTTVAAVRDFDAGVSVGYGRAYVTDKPTRVAVLAIGYADGLHRALSNRMTVRTSYGDARQVGRICMDMCMIDATEQPDLKVGDEVEVFGKRAPCAALAERCDTIPYELLCAVSKRVPRAYSGGA